MATSGITATTPRAEAFRDDVNAELVRYLYRQAPGSMVALIVVGTILAYVLWNIAPREWLLGWLAALLAVMALRFAQIRTFFRRAPAQRGHHALGRRSPPRARRWSARSGPWPASCSSTPRIRSA